MNNKNRGKQQEENNHKNKELKKIKKNQATRPLNKVSLHYQ